MRQLRAFLLFLGLTIAFGAQAELRTYDVDARYRQEVFAALNSVLNPNERVSSGRISLLPTGQLLIDTSPEMHEQVAAVLESINNYQVEATPRVTLRYWAVLGTRFGAEAASTEQGTAVPEVLNGVLDELRRVHADLAFRLHGTATLVSESGQRSQLSGDTLTIAQTAYVQQSMLNVELAINFRYAITTQIPKSAEDETLIPYTRREQQGLSLHTSLAPNEFVVIGENVIINDGGTVFYIVQWAVPN